MEREEFRQHASECMRMAECTRDPADKAAWERLAEIWHRNAQRADGSRRREPSD